MLKKFLVKKDYVLNKLQGYIVQHRVSCSVMFDSATPWAVARQAPPSMGFSRQEYWNRWTSPSPEDLLDPDIELGLLDCRQILYHLSHQGNIANIF